ncbi:nuclease-related domain-containing protein [Neobacillus vireti]|uniref:nuclease-related domain-containing protein n=1 Tax=Neobacillus vireti TaxID=220686 RepID=UPI002FFED5DF
MIGKLRSIPLKILILRALLRRLPKNHSKRTQIAEELSGREAGYQSEEYLDTQIQQLLGSKYIIFHDLNFSEGKSTYQIDNLLISPQLALIIEVKNMTGVLTFDSENDQFYQTVGEKIKGYQDPVSQVQRHQSYIKKQLKENNFPPVPVDYLIVINNQNAVLKFNGTPSEVRNRVCKSHSFDRRLPLIENNYTEQFLTEKDLRKLSRLLLKKNTPPTNYILEKYDIKLSEISIGVLCPECYHHLPMLRKRKQWFCSSCKNFSKDAHILTFQDYFLLFNTKITNQQFRSFAKLSSADTAGRILRSSNLIITGANKGRYYHPEKIPW